jgi:glycosyltransferase involved in cell wall biosynthesis
VRGGRFRPFVPSVAHEDGLVVFSIHMAELVRNVSHPSRNEQPREGYESRRPLKILQVFTDYLNPGGEAKSVARIAEDLESAGHKVNRFWRSSKEWQSPGAPKKWKQPFLLWKNSAVLNELRQVQDAHRADVWILHNVVPVISLGVYGFARQLGVPIFQWLHNYRPISPSGSLMAGARLLEPDDPFLAFKEILHGSWRGPVMTAWLAAAYKLLKIKGDFSSVRAWIAVSDQMRSIFSRAGWPSERLFTLRHSWHLSSDQVSEQDEGHFLFLGRMVESKGVRFLVELWSNPALRNVRLVMAGQGPLAEELRDVSPPNVVWTGHIEGEAKRQWLATCRAVVFPAIWPEPLSTVAYEAYQLGKPVLASDLGGMKENVFENQTGRLLRPADASEWLNAIVSLDAEKARELGRKGREWLECQVNPQVWNRQFDHIVQAAL